jgi:transcriptional regulator
MAAIKAAARMMQKGYMSRNVSQLLQSSRRSKAERVASEKIETSRRTF